MRRTTILAVSLATLLVTTNLQTTYAKNGIFENVVYGLRQAGFDFDGKANYLSGGHDLTVSRTFTGETLDFGATELTIQGTPVLSFSTGGRGLQMIEASFNTNDSPFNYSFTTDTGNQVTTVNGSLFLDATASMNSLGFYDMQLDASSRQTIINDGRYSDEENPNDFDIGPIDIRGNIFADLLATVTDPIFDALGVDNIFSHFSGAGVFEDTLNNKAAKAREKALAGKALTEEEIAELASVSAMAGAMGLQIPDLSFLDTAEIAESITPTETSSADKIVPEPASLLLLALTAPAILMRRRKTRQ